MLPGRENRSPLGAAAAGALTAARIQADSAAADVQAAAPGHVIFSRTYFGAWKARLDGREAPVLIANARDLAVAVPAGNHHVEFDYDRAPFARGVLLQAAAFLTILLALARGAKL